MTTIVFAGPSIFGLAAAELSGLDVRPPAACGDLLAAAFERPQQIALIDGIFENAPSVWHKEILFALSEGIIVSGAASMGALRAAECAVFGMVGVGAIFHDYRSGRRTADADVAVTHAPAEFGFRPLTEAFVDVEATLQALKMENMISEAEGEQFGKVATELHFSRRSWSAILHMAELQGERRNELRQLVKSLRRSQKQDDARALLAAVRDGSITRPSNVITAARLARTPFLENLKDEILARSSKAKKSR
jgi:hypothetical protein